MVAAKTRPELGTSKRWMKPQPCLKSWRMGSRPPGDVFMTFASFTAILKNGISQYVTQYETMRLMQVPASYCYFKVLQLMMHLLASHEIDFGKRVCKHSNDTQLL